MKIRTLKAVPHRTRSVITAYIKPSEVTIAGANATQIRLFLSAVSVAEDWKIFP